MLGPLNVVPQRQPAADFQAECRGFETRLPLQSLASAGGRLLSSRDPLDELAGGFRPKGLRQIGF
jgi:hypothetical protein